MMRRMKLLALWLFAAMLVCCAFACAAEMTPYDVTNMEEAERFVPFVRYGRSQDHPTRRSTALPR